MSALKFFGVRCSFGRQLQYTQIPARSFITSKTSFDIKNKSPNNHLKAKVPEPKLGAVAKLKKFVAFYKAGFIQIFSNRKEAGLIKSKIRQGHQVTWREQQLIRSSEKDTLKLVPFGILVALLPEIIPILIISVPQMIPSTCITEEQQLKKRTKMQQVRNQITATAIRSASSNSNLLTTLHFASPGNIIKTIKAYHELFELKLLEHKPLKTYCKFMQLPTWGHSSQLKSRLTRKIRVLRSDDQLLQREGVDYLTTKELILANEERGMRTLDQTDDQLKKALSDWIKVSLFDAPQAPEVLLVLSRIFVYNIPTKA